MGYRIRGRGYVKSGFVGMVFVYEVVRKNHIKWVANALGYMWGRWYGRALIRYTGCRACLLLRIYSINPDICEGL